MICVRICTTDADAKAVDAHRDFPDSASKFTEGDLPSSTSVAVVDLAVSLLLLYAVGLDLCGLPIHTSKLKSVMMSLGRLDKVEVLLKHATEVDPTIALAHFRLSTIYRQTGKTEDAKRELAEYQKYKDMKEKLKTMYRTMRLESSKPEPDDAEANN
jgi:hypothetical protein